MAFPTSGGNLAVEAYLGGWRTVPLLQEQGVTITGGRLNRSPTASPATFDGLIDNRSGNWDPRNPFGAYFETLGEGTPLRCRWLADVSDVFGTDATDSWGTSTSGHAWTIGTSTSDYDVSGGKGLHSVPAASTVRQSYLAATSTLPNGELRGTVSVLPSTAITGGSIGFLIMLRGTSLSSYVAVQVELTTANQVKISLVDTNSPGIPEAGPVTTNLVHGTGITYAWAAQVDGHMLHGKVWDAAGVEPYAWQVTANVPDIPATGWYGVMSSVEAGNTNAKPIVFSWDNIELSVPQFFGDITKLEPAWDETGRNATVQLAGQDLLGRLQQGESPLRSALNRGVLSGLATGLVAYWPCEDDRQARTLASGVTGGSPMTITGSPSLASYSRFDCSKALPVTSTDSRFAGVVPPYANTSELTVRFLLHVPTGMTSPSSILTLQMTGTAVTWYIYYNGAPGSLFIKAYNNVDGAIYTGGGIGFNLDDRPVLVTFRLWQLVDIHFDLTVMRTDTGASGSASDTLSGYTMGQCQSVLFNRDLNASGMAIGHVVVQSNTDTLNELNTVAQAWNGETAGRRIERLCGEEGIEFSYRGDLDASAPMGPQRVDDLASNLQGCADVDQGTLTGSAGDSALEYRTLADITNQLDAALALTYSSKHLSGVFRPTSDRFGLVNDVTVTRTNGSSGRAEITTGRRSVSAPPAGVGRIDTSTTHNVQLDEQAGQLAWWLASVGSFDGDRFPSLTIQLERAPFLGSSNEALRFAALALRFDDLVTVDGASTIKRYDEIPLLARGWQKTLNRYTHKVEVNCAPAEPFQVFELEDATYGHLHSAGTVVAVAIDDSSTALKVATTAGPLWTTAAGDLPIPLMLEGERMSVTAIANELVTYRAVGTAAHADNANVTPGLPAGHAAGDLLVMPSVIRNTAATPSSSTQGYVPIFSDGNVVWWAKIDSGSESAPTVSFTGGSAGDTTSAQIIALPGKWYDVNNLVVAKAGCLNPSAQDVAYPGLVVPMRDCVILYGAWKQDDYTSATSPGTEIAESSTTTGNDQSLTWAYQIQTTAAPIAAGSFTITGGASAISKGYVLALRCDRQAFTVTRAVNGVAKSHSVGAAVEQAVRTGWAYGG